MKLRRPALAVTALLAVAGCATRPPLPVTPALAIPLPAQLHLTEAPSGREWLAVLAQEADTLRFTLLTPLGVPQARLVVADGRVRRDGFQAPSRTNETLLTGVLFALARSETLGHTYPQARQRDTERELCLSGMARIRLGTHCWRSATAGTDRWRLELGDETWLIERLVTEGGAQR